MSKKQFSNSEIDLLHKEDFMLKSEKTSAEYSGDGKLFLREIKKTKIGLFEAHFLKKDPSSKLSRVEEITNEFSFTFTSLVNAIHFLRRQENDEKV